MGDSKSMWCADGPKGVVCTVFVSNDVSKRCLCAASLWASTRRAPRLRQKKLRFFGKSKIFLSARPPQLVCHGSYCLQLTQDRAFGEYDSPAFAPLVSFPLQPLTYTHPPLVWIAWRYFVIQIQTLHVRL
jgi:hypothetical protein